MRLKIDRGSEESTGQFVMASYRCQSELEVYTSIYTHGFAIIRGDIDDHQLSRFESHLQSLPLNPNAEREPFDKTHYSFNNHPELEDHFYEALLESPTLKSCLDLLVPNWSAGRFGGDIVTAGLMNEFKMKSCCCQTHVQIIKKTIWHQIVLVVLR